MAALLIKNGYVIDPASGVDGVLDVLTLDGVIRGVGPALEAPAGAQVIDATGLYVAPGFIDMHVHLREPGFEHAETIESGRRIAKYSVRIRCPRSFLAILDAQLGCTI